MKNPWFSAALLTEAGQKLFAKAWNIGKFRAGGTKAQEWTLFVYRDDRPNRAELAKPLSVAPESLTLLTLDGRPLAAEGDEVATGDARLDQALATCAEKRMALPLDPKALAGLPGSPWSTPKAAEHWKVGVAVAEILKLGPPEGWHQFEYQRTSRRGGRPSVAWVTVGVEPRAAIAKALGVAEDEIKLLGRASEEEATSARRPWCRPHIVELVFDEPVGLSPDCTAPGFMPSEVDADPEPDTLVTPAFATMAEPLEGASA